MPDKPVTLATIAEICGVNQGTVSRVLNNRLGPNFSVTQESRAHILETARRLRYRPNLTAQSLRQRQTKIVSILREVPQHYKMLSGIYETATRVAVEFFRERHIVLSTLYVDPSGQESSLPPWNLDGLILMGNFDSASLIEQIEDQRIPYVYFNGFAGPTGTSVITDDQGGSALAMEHLIGLGHRRIGFYLDRPIQHDHYSYRERHAQYLASLAQIGETPPINHDQIQPDAEAFLRIVKREKISAVLTYDHFAACRLISSAGQLGMNLPEELSLVAFNDEYPCEAVNPPLTTVAVPATEMSQMALNNLWNRIEYQESTKNHNLYRLPEKLIVRCSTCSMNT